ncbi:MAG: hypothetical protein ABH864_06860 [archaeon]
MGLRRNRKGIFFLMLTLIIISLFLLSVTFYSGVVLRQSVQKRVETLSEFVTSVEDDLPRQVFIFGYNAIAVIELSAITGGYLGEGNLQVVTDEAFFSGTVLGTPHSLLSGASYDSLEFLLKERASKISAEVELNNPSINITQEDPWNLKFTFTVDMVVRDVNELAYWNKTVVAVSYINIQNFTDPMYFVAPPLLGYGLHNVDKDIVINPDTTFGDFASLQSQLENGYYRDYSGGAAPSFIDRLEGNIGGVYPAPRYPEYGIESFVDLESDLGGGSLPQRSVVDYIYFNGQVHSYCQVGSGTLPVWFRLDNPEHLVSYGVACD